jgi:hypothetical protein
MTGTKAFHGFNDAGQARSPAPRRRNERCPRRSHIPTRPSLRFYRSCRRCGMTHPARGGLLIVAGCDWRAPLRPPAVGDTDLIGHSLIEALPYSWPSAGGLRRHFGSWRTRRGESEWRPDARARATDGGLARMTPNTMRGWAAEAFLNSFSRVVRQLIICGRQPSDQAASSFLPERERCRARG